MHRHIGFFAKSAYPFPRLVYRQIGKARCFLESMLIIDLKMIKKETR